MIRITATTTSSSMRSEEHTSELQSQSNLVCRLLLEKKKKNTSNILLTQNQLINKPFNKLNPFVHSDSYKSYLYDTSYHDSSTTYYDEYTCYTVIHV